MTQHSNVTHTETDQASDKIPREQQTQHQNQTHESGIDILLMINDKNS